MSRYNTEEKKSEIILIELYKDLVKQYEVLTKMLVDLLFQLKTDCYEQSVEELTKQFNVYRECQNFQKANCDIALKD